MIYHSPHLSQTGFTLLEALVAFSILGLSLGALMQVFAAGLRGAALSEEYSYASVLAESRMALFGTEQLLEEGNDQGEFNERYSWRSLIEPYQAEKEDIVADVGEMPVKLLHVQVEVLWQSGVKNRSLVLDSLRLVGDR